MTSPSKALALTPHLTVQDVAEAAQFYKTALGFQIEMMLPGGPEGKIMHAELSCGKCKIMLGPESPARGIRAPITLGHPPSVSLYLSTERIDSAHAHAVSSGAIELLPPSVQFFGAKTSIITDPNGHQWMLSQEKIDEERVSMKDRVSNARIANASRSGSEHVPVNRPKKGARRRRRRPPADSGR